MASNTRLYDLLGVPKDASPSDIKKAYHRMALQCHPDKAGDAGAAQFKAIKQAYDILSDPSKRSLYDRLGERGVEMSENPLASSFVDSVGFHYAIILATILMIFVVTMLILFLSFLAARVDGRTTWTFAKVFSPIFILDIAGFLAILPTFPLLFKKGPDPEGDATEQQHGVTCRQKLALVLMYVMLGSFAIFTILVPIGLDRADPSDSWRCFFIPLFVADGITSGMFLWHTRSPDSYILLLQRAAGVTISFRHALGLWLSDTLATASRLPFWVLIACRIDNVISVSWFVVGIPLYVALVATEVGIALLSLAQATRPDAEKGSVLGPILVFGSILAVVLLSALLIFAKLDGASISLANALIPVFVGVAVAFLGSCCGFCAACTTAPIPEYADPQSGAPPYSPEQQTPAEDSRDHLRFSDSRASAA